MTATVAFRWIGRIALIAFAALVLLILAVLVVLPRVTHGAALTVLTGSMQPALPVGSVVIERPADAGALQVGDIVTYQQAPGQSVYITHRIAAIDTSTSPAMFTFKGDANPVVDQVPVPATAIRGKVWFDIPYIGRLRPESVASGVRSGGLLLGVLGLGCYSIFQLVGGVREYRRPATPDGVPTPDANDADAPMPASVDAP
jgi:signal peptidase I